MNGKLARIAVLACGITVAAAVQVAGAPQASALPALERVVASSLTDSDDRKGVTAWCPAGTRVLAGGGWVFGADSDKVMLRRLTPKVSPSTGQDGWNVSAAEVLPGVTSDWRVEAYAVCAEEPPGYERIARSHHPALPWNSAPAKSAWTLCPRNSDDSLKRAIGVGADISTGGIGDLPGIMLYRLNTNNELTSDGEASAVEVVDGYDGVWDVTVHLICANLATIEVDNWSKLVGSEDVKTAQVACDQGTFVHGMQSLVFSPIGVGINGIRPSADLRTVTLRAAETTPISDNWDLNVGASCRA